MVSTPVRLIAIAAALAATACKTANDGSATAAQGTTDSGTPPAAGSGGTASGGSAPGSIPSLISVNLQNVLNDLSVSLNVDRNSIPVTAQVPIDVAAAVCGVSVDALAASLASGNGKCTATTSSPQLTQVVQQQISTGGSVQGGDQTIGNTTSGNMM